MIGNSEKDETSDDAFDLQENNASNTKALDSKLWELKSLKKLNFSK